MAETTVITPVMQQTAEKAAETLLRAYGNGVPGEVIEHQLSSFYAALEQRLRDEGHNPDTVRLGLAEIARIIKDKFSH
jgi:hypothetical protein